jgi:hypothetical protein
MAEQRSLALPSAESSTLLAEQWRRLTRTATFVAIQRASDGRRVLVLAPPPPFH